MTSLQVYRDDGLLAQSVARRDGAAASTHPLAWLGVPLVRAAEYGSLIVLTRIADPGRLPFCFALLAVLAFHHYDSAYRVRQQGEPPPPWIRLAGLGWEGRILLATALALAGVLGPSLLVGAIALALLYGGESARSWVSFGRSGRPAASSVEEPE